MALIPKFFVCTALQPINPASNPIKQGMLVALDVNGVHRVASAGDCKSVYGIATDNFQTNAASMPGIYPGWQNRVSDSFDETKASGKITVYHSGGEFATDQFLNSGTALDTTKIGSCLIADTTGVVKYGYATVADCLAAGVQPVGMLTLNAASYPSGVPGTDINGSIALKGDNSNQYIEFKLLV